MAAPSSPTGLNATSASLLGLLAIEDWPRPWTSYELAKQAGRSLHWFWPRAQRRLLAVPRELVRLGYAEAHEHATGRRPATRYSITEAGRTALADWLREPGEGIRFEAEELIRVFFADHGDADQLRGTLRRIIDQTIDDGGRLAEIASGVDRDVMHARGNVNALGIRLVGDLYDTVIEWAQWALAEVEEWDDVHHPWDGAADVFDAIIARATPKDRSDPAERATG